MLTTSARAT